MLLFQLSVHISGTITRLQQRYGPPSILSIYSSMPSAQTFCAALDSSYMTFDELVEGILQVDPTIRPAYELARKAEPRTEIMAVRGQNPPYVAFGYVQDGDGKYQWRGTPRQRQY